MLGRRLDAPHNDEADRQGGDDVQHVVTLHTGEATPAATVLHGTQRAPTVLQWCGSVSTVFSGLADATGSGGETRRVVLYLPTRLVVELERIASSEGNGVNAVIRRLISVALYQQASP